MQEIVLPCPDLDEALAFFTNQLGFRLESVFPADDPRALVITGHGVTLRLERTGPGAAPIGGHKPGRAGMSYRDLVPDRLGGKLIASQIRIAGGGPVADYVHYHELEFQLIYCTAGWVRVVYEDQGPPFVLRPGDAVLQPPKIRHRVLECAPGTEVVEIGSPAEHVTRVDHELALPTLVLAPERDFSGQRFVRHEAASANWGLCRRAGFEARDLGIFAATQGRAMAHVVRRIAAAPLESGRRDAGQLLLCVLRGELTLADGGRLGTGDACTLPAGAWYRFVECTDELEFLEFVLFIA